MKKLLILISILVPTFLSAQINFLPKPEQVKYEKGEMLVEKGLGIISEGADNFNVNYLKEHLERVFDFDIAIGSGRQTITLKHVQGLENEEYKLSIDDKGIVIESSSKAGEFYAIQTLMQMMPAGIYKDFENPQSGMLLWEWPLPYIKISDKPRFSYRGSMLDVSRTYFNKDYVIRHLEWLGYHKINKFHFHLTDDNGWRIEIKKYPKLTNEGCYRGDGLLLPATFGSGKEPYGGYFTQKDIKEIVAFAKERNIEVIPEIEFPGHSKGIAVAYPEILCDNIDTNLKSVQLESGNVWCVGREENFKMIENILKEVASLFDSEYIHIGGDEVVYDNWNNCPRCQAVMKKEGFKTNLELFHYFIRRVDKIAHKFGKKIAGWDEISEESSIDPQSRVYAWRNADYGVKAVQRRLPVIMQIAKYCYVDMKYSEPERGHNWAGIVSMPTIYSFDPYKFEIRGENYAFTEEEKKCIVGVQGNMWAEMLVWPPHFAEYQMFPKLCALAEIGWTPQELRDYADFDARLTGSHFERMAAMGIRFRLPYPEVKSENVDCNVTKVSATLPYPSAVVRYTTNGTEPNVNSPVYQGDIFTNAPENLRFATFFYDNKSISVKVPGAEKLLTPAVTVTSSEAMGENKYCTKKMAADYDFESYFRSVNAPQKGEWVLYTFDSPVECSEIEVATGFPGLDVYVVTDGHVEYSFNGKDWIKGDSFRYGKVIIRPDKAVKAVKIVHDGEGERKYVGYQDLRIKK